MRKSEHAKEFGFYPVEPLKGKEYLFGSELFKLQDDWRDMTKDEKWEEQIAFKRDILDCPKKTGEPGELREFYIDDLTLEAEDKHWKEYRGYVYLQSPTQDCPFVDFYTLLQYMSMEMEL